MKTTLAAALIALCGVAAPLAPAHAAAPVPQSGSGASGDLSATYRKLIEEVGPALVTIKFLMKIEGGQFGDSGQGQEAEVTGVVIEPTGLILCSNTQMGGNQAITSRAGVTLTPTDIKVLIGDDTEGVKAKVVARDSDLDLAWIQIEAVEGESAKAYKHVSIADSSPVQIGDKILKLDRMPKFFDRALVVSEGRVGGRTGKPRDLLLPSGLGEGQLDLGIPLFSDAGRFVGLSVLQMPSREDMEGGDANNMREMMGVLILPADRVAKATVNGKEMAARGDLEKEEAAKREAAEKAKAEADGEAAKEAGEMGSGGEGEKDGAAPKVP